MEYDLVLTGGQLVDPVSGRRGGYDLGFANGKVAAVAPELDPAKAARRLDTAGAWVLPGVVDVHVHTSRRHGGQNAHRMIARGGVCTMLDLAGPWDEFLGFATTEGAGLNVACIQQVRPGLTVADADPSPRELQRLLDKTLAAGGLGFKLLGGHYPLTPEASRRVLAVANEARAYVAFHAGSTATASDLDGVVEAIQLAKGLRVHLPHVNSYCTAKVLPRSHDEISQALELLRQNRNIRSESYLATINGTSAKCIDGQPESHATRLCLEQRGYPPTEEGLEAAIREGYGRINEPQGGENVNITGPAAVKSWRARGTVTSVNFPLNPPDSRFLAATARCDDGRFVVDALASDGGGHPRNVTVERAMALVRFEALTIEEVVHKTSTVPAALLGCPAKGHLGVGADADVTGVDPVSGKPAFSLVAGRPVLWQGALVGEGSTVLTTAAGVAALGDQGVPYEVIDPAAGALYGDRPAQPGLGGPGW